MPPDVELPKAPICSPPVRDEDMIADWTPGIERNCPKREVYTITRDMNRLRDLDARRFEPVISRVQELLPTIKANYGERIPVRQGQTDGRHGQTDEVKSQGLVQKTARHGWP